jgi:hypothetical protein
MTPCLLGLLVFLTAALSQTQEPPIALHSTGGDAHFSSDVVEPHFGTTVVVPSGLRGDIYYLHENTLILPKFEKLKPVGTIYTNGLNIPPQDFSEGFPGVTKRTEWFAIDYTGRFYISKPGKYLFALASDDGSKLYIDNRVIIDNDGVHSPLRMDNVVKLEGGLHNIRVSYFQGPRYTVCLMLAVSGPGESGVRPFNINEFKPPANPEDWKFGSPEDIDKLPDPKAKETKPPKSKKTGSK